MEKHANVLALEAIFRNGNVAFMKTKAGYGFIATALRSHEVHHEGLEIHGWSHNVDIVSEKGTDTLTFMPEHLDTLIEYRGMAVMGK